MEALYIMYNIMVGLHHQDLTVHTHTDLAMMTYNSFASNLISYFHSSWRHVRHVCIE